MGSSSGGVCFVSSGTVETVTFGREATSSNMSSGSRLCCSLSNFFFCNFKPDVSPLLHITFCSYTVWHKLSKNLTPCDLSRLPFYSQHKLHGCAKKLTGIILFMKLSELWQNGIHRIPWFTHILVVSLLIITLLNLLTIFCCCDYQVHNCHFY